MLSKMRRHITKDETLALIDKIRSSVPGIHLRTTLITGHPGETEEDFAELMDFVQTQRFERLGVFPYSHEDDTNAFKHYKDDIPEEVKEHRAELIMQAQAEISLEHNEQKVGQRLKVIIDRREKDGTFVGRTEFDSPEVDPEVLITKGKPKVGEFADVLITGATDYDLEGQVE